MHTQRWFSKKGWKNKNCVSHNNSLKLINDDYKNSINSYILVKYSHTTQIMLEEVFSLASRPSKKLRTLGYL